MKAVILQPSYIPWRGYFDLIRQADIFVFYDDVQYDRRGWRNRNRIKTAAGSQWLTIPVLARGAQVQNTPINEVRICWDREWGQAHVKTIRHSYARAPHFARYLPMVEAWYETRPEFLADFTISVTIELSQTLGIQDTRFMRSSALEGITGSKTARLLSILKRIGATEYLSGPSAADYIDETAFERAGIGCEYIQYQYPEYPQLHPPFDPHVSVLDLLLMTGPDALEYIAT